MATTESVALLFTDVAGSTELAHRLSPDAADEVRRRHFAILRRSVGDTGGIEVKNLGDGIMAVFASASKALACGVAMQQEVERDNRGREHAVGLRVGLSGGEVTREEGDYFGDPVIEAARLCSQCRPGQILAANVVRLMAGRRCHLELRSIGELVLKGVRDPVDTVEVLWEPAPISSHVPLPPRLAVRSARGFDVVGRESELALLGAAATRVFAGDGREIVLVCGEAGQGKTTLVAESARLLSDKGACVLFGHCEQDLATPYQLFAEGFGHYAAHADADELRDLLEAHGSELVRLAPAIAGRIADLPPSKAADADSERYLLFAAVPGLLSSISEDVPVVIVLEDLQWADGGSLAMLRHLTAAEQSMRVLLLATYRDSELPKAPLLRETLGSLWRHQGVSRVELDGLDRRGVQSLVEAAAGPSLDDSGLDDFGVALAEAIHAETDGNPYFVTEVLRHLRDTGAIHQNLAGRWVAEGSLQRSALPESVREVIAGRVVRLGPIADRVLATAAVVGRDFDLDVLELAADVPLDLLLDILDAAETASLVQEADAPGRYRFGHSLVQRTLYEDLGAARRARLHEQVALALETVCAGDHRPRAGELAHHWLHAPSPGNLDKAVRCSREAGDVALSSLTPDDALGHYGRALDRSSQIADPDPVLLVDLAIGLGTAQRQTGDPAFRDTLLGAAREATRLGDVRRLVSACLANDRGFYSAVGATDREKVTTLEAALELLPPDHPDRALVLATLCSELAHGSSLERRRALAEDAIAVAGRSGDEAVVVRVLNHVYIPLQVPSLLELTQARSTEALVRASRIGDPVLKFWAATWRAESVARAGDLDEMERCMAVQATMAEELDQPVFTWGRLFVGSLRAQISGDTDVAEQYATEALRIGSEGGQPDAALIFGAQLNIVAGQRGTQHELIPLIDRMASETPDIPRTFFLSLLAKAHVEVGELDAARALLAEFAQSGFRLPFDQLWLTGMVDFAEAAIECEDPAYAAPLLSQLHPWADQLPVTGASALGPVSHYLGGLATVLGRLDEAEDHFRCAHELGRRLGAKFFVARTELLWARMLLGRDAPGDRGRAGQLLHSASAAGAAHGYGVVERRARELLQRVE
jgi:class 3 adenylate cyclase